MKNRAIRCFFAVGWQAAFISSALPAQAKGAGPGGLIRAMGAGPIVLLLCLSAFAVLYLAASSVRRGDSLVALAHAAVRRLGRSRVLLGLWGILAELLLISAGLILSRVAPLGLLAAAMLFSALALAGLGTFVAAFAVGRRLNGQISGGEMNPLRALDIGLQLFFLAVVIPVVGWVAIVAAAAVGVGAILTGLAQGEWE